MYQNIIYITGNNSYAVAEEVLRWTRLFESKYGNENIDRYRLDTSTIFPQIRDSLMTSGLFATKRLFLFSGGIEKKTKGSKEGFEIFLDAHAHEIPNDHFLVFHHISKKEEGLIGVYDERGKTFVPGWLQKNATLRSYDTLWDQSYWEGVYPDLLSHDITTVIDAYKRGDTSLSVDERNRDIGHLIASTLEMMTLLKAGGKSFHDTDLIYSEGGGSLFALVDAINAEDGDASQRIFRTMVTREKSQDILSPLLSNLRSTLYIKYLEESGMNTSDIGTKLGVHPFVLKKNLAARISYKKIFQIYQNLVHIDRAYKSGKGLQDDELGRIFGIELVLLGLKKENFMYNTPRNL